ncbi:MAG: DUF262 domain-containing HNH endonuclease family protein [Terracidiphilus sp.]|jgi:hypothetical protein
MTAQKSSTDLGIDFEIVGIASALSRYTLRVPLNQRSYAWEDQHVTRLLEDLSAQLVKPGDERPYFLGTIVLAHDEQNNLLVADGQQRLATTSILIAAIRDYLLGTGIAVDKMTSDKYTRKFLLEYDEENEEFSPKLYLNAMDRDFFVKGILSPPDDPDREAAKPKFASHLRLVRAAALAHKHIEAGASLLPKGERKKWLVQWVNFLEHQVLVIAIKVPQDIDAYKIFETLNDRGLRASQVDILKSHLFQQAQDRLETDVEPKWTSMVSVIESLGDDELVLHYVRHFWISRQGPTTEDELASNFKLNVTGRKRAVAIATALEEQAADYIALLTPLEHPRLGKLTKEARGYLAAITTLLKIVQIRPLLLAILENFTPLEAKKAYEKCLSWSVRYLVVGGAGGGVLERYYGLRAKAVSEGEIKTANELAEKMRAIVPDDITFERAFKIHEVSKIVVARYYLHSLENYKRGESTPQIGYFEIPENSTNLEHIMPDRECEGWKISFADAQANYKRLGNMTLLTAKLNSRLGCAAFSQKKKVYTESTFLLTQEVAENREWTPKQVDKRQIELAAMAPKVWPL